MILVAYDIPDNGRRLKVAEALEGFGFRVQYSVFEAVLDDGEQQELIARLESLIDATTDKLRVYFICRSCEARVAIMGEGSLTTEPEVFVV